MKITKKEFQQIVKEEVEKYRKVKTLEARKQQIQEELNKLEGEIIEEEKNPSAKLRHRGDVVFPAGSAKVKDDKDHFPVNNINQARNALARASQYNKVPSWYTGSLSELVKKVQNKAHRKYPSIEVTKKSAKPGKG
jgi:hypothetical protein